MINSFYHQVGIISTVTPWNRPTYEKVKDFLTTVKQKTSIFDRYSLNLAGGILYDFNSTWDVDIFLVSDTSDNFQLEEDLHDLYNIALNTTSILIDAQWCNTILPDISIEYLTSPNFKQVNLTHKKLGYIKSNSTGELITIDRRDSIDTNLIGEYLIELTRAYPGDNPKIINRILSYSDRILKATIPATMVLDNDYRYYFANTNR